MKTMSLSAALLTAVLALGCTNTIKQVPAPDSGTSDTTDPAPQETPADPAPADTTAEVDAGPTLKAPTIDSVNKMAGALHVFWTNAETTADEVVLERKTSTVPYVIVATLPGDSDNLHDVDANQATMYTYRVRCKKGSAYSPYSKEKSGSPK